MNQRLIWNFEFLPQTNSQAPIFPKSAKQEDIKWEIRYFWPKEHIITLNTIDTPLLDITHYQQKSRDDVYYLIPNKNYNIKKRHHELVYKPELEHIGLAIGYGAKIQLNAADDDRSLIKNPILKDITKHLKHEHLSIAVKKTAFIYTFKTTPKVKLELARLEIHDDYFFSLCLESKSLQLVEAINKQLLYEPISCDYVTFLKKITSPC